MSKVVTIRGSMKFMKEMIDISAELEIKYGYIVIQCVYCDKDFSDSEKKILGDIHYRKIEISDAIFVVNVSGYIGESVKKEIEYAKKLGKEIMYLES